MAFPRSAQDKTSGLVYFARMLDKIRLHATGKLPSEYHAYLGVGFDGRCCRFLRVDYAVLCEQVLPGDTNDQILEWCFSNGRRPNEEEILVWNSFMAKRGWRDEASESLEKYKAENGLGHRKDLLTFFDFYEADEKRSP